MAALKSAERLYVVPTVTKRADLWQIRPAVRLRWNNAVCSAGRQWPAPVAELRSGTAGQQVRCGPPPEADTGNDPESGSVISVDPTTMFGCASMTKTTIDI